MSKEHETGQRIGPYVISSVAGEGAMGKVYKGRDERLGRDVAIKVLSEGFAADKTNRNRFLREARAASSLNHPNICTIHDAGERDGTPYLVMELLDGQNLRDRTAARAFEVAEIVDIAIQVSEALDAAHAKGVIHRDIKPANVFLTRSGTVKILDFGLAKIAPEASSASMALTAPGMVVGTVAYMSPEQVRGDSVDARSDLFSLGILLYEMCAGVQPFQGSNEVAVLDGILTREPLPIDRLRPSLPPELTSIIHKALEKDRGRRYQSAAQFRADLKRVRRKLSNPAGIEESRAAIEAFPEPRKQSPRWLMPTVALGAPLLAICGWYLWPSLSHTRFRSAAQFEQYDPVTSPAGEALDPSLTPDGKTLVYAARSGEHWHIFVQRARAGNAFDISGSATTDDGEPAFSPDGERIAFRSERAGGGLYIMGATGEHAHKLTGSGHNPSWSPDGEEIVYATQPAGLQSSGPVSASQLWRVRVNDGSLRPFPAPDARQPNWSPHGHRVAYWSYDRDKAERRLWTASVADGGAVPLLSGWSPVWSPDGNYLYFARNRGGADNIWRLRIDERTGQAQSDPEPLKTPSANCTPASFSRDGQSLAYVQRPSGAAAPEADIWIARTGKGN